MEGFIDNNTNDHYELFELPFQIQSSFLNSHSSFGGSHASSISVASPLLIQRNPSAQKPRPVRRLNSRPSEPVVCWPVGKCCERIDLGPSQLQGSRWSLERNHGEKMARREGGMGVLATPLSQVNMVHYRESHWSVTDFLMNQEQLHQNGWDLHNYLERLSQRLA